MLRGRELAEGYPEMIGIVEGIEEVFMERMDILEAGESVQDEGELLCECLLREFDLSGVEICFSLAFPASPRFQNIFARTSNSANLKSCANLRWQAALRPAQDNIQEFLGGRNRLYVFPRCLHRCELLNLVEFGLWLQLFFDELFPSGAKALT